MRILEYIVAGIVEGIFFLALASLIGYGLAQLINRKHDHRKASHYRPARFSWLEERRAKHHMNNLDRLARKIERKLERRRIGWPWDLG
ncbi:MAG: hypothetical protein M0Z69_16770 [Actinomycetota bacterium]|nr:hypothetical protein [Actinomycetota bacterium]